MRLKFDRYTKIVWSVDGCALKQRPFLQAPKGCADVIRVIYSKDQTDNILAYLGDLKKSTTLSKKSVMVDVSQSPRGVVSVEQEKDVCFGDLLSLSSHKSWGEVVVLTKEWGLLFEEGATVYLGCGDIALKAEKVTEKKIEVRVLQGGSIVSGMEVFVPKTQRPPSVFDLSFIDIKPFQKLMVDYVVLPGVLSARQVSLARRRLSKGGGHCPWIIVKVDSNDVYQKIEELLQEADGVMLARRELALTVEPSLVPLICKEVIHNCNKQGKIAIVASEMLMSMRYNRTPTRAEVSDVANGVLDGADAVVLSADIAFGDNGSSALECASKTILDIEKKDDFKTNWQKEKLAVRGVFDAVVWGACKTAERTKAKAIVCLTKEGNTALRVAGNRSQIPIIALTFSTTVKRRLSLVRGVSSDILEGEPVLDKLLLNLNEQLKEKSWLKKGDFFVLVTVTLSSISLHASDLFTIQEIS